MTADTPRRDDAVMATRYWLTDKGMTATDEWWAEQQAQGDDS